jgi:hypothetical protein
MHGWRRNLSVIAITFALGSAAPFAAMAAERETLPVSVIPAHYELYLKPNAEALTFSGTVAVTVDVKTPTQDVARLLRAARSFLGLQTQRLNKRRMNTTRGLEEDRKKPRVARALVKLRRWDAFHLVLKPDGVSDHMEAKAWKDRVGPCSERAERQAGGERGKYFAGPAARGESI